MKILISGALPATRVDPKIYAAMMRAYSGSIGSWCALVAELVDAADSKSVVLTDVGVQVPPGAPNVCIPKGLIGRTSLNLLGKIVLFRKAVLTHVTRLPGKWGALIGVQDKATTVRTAEKDYAPPAS